MAGEQPGCRRPFAGGVLLFAFFAYLLVMRKIIVAFRRETLRTRRNGARFHRSLSPSPAAPPPMRHCRASPAREPSFRARERT
jgi:hypothetical protein